MHELCNIGGYYLLRIRHRHCNDGAGIFTLAKIAEFLKSNWYYSETMSLKKCPFHFGNTLKK